MILLRNNVRDAWPVPVCCLCDPVPKDDQNREAMWKVPCSNSAHGLRARLLSTSPHGFDRPSWAGGDVTCLFLLACAWFRLPCAALHAEQVSFLQLGSA